MNDIEQQLASLTPPPLPSDWRKDILAAASKARETQEHSRTPAWKQRIAWGSLAAVWLVILSLNFATERPEPSASLAKMNPVILKEHWRQEKQLIADLLAPTPAIEVPSPAKPIVPVAPDPRSSDRGQRFIPVV